ncbi:hypothetical protein E2C01_042129 [Portunus trituberculatus]|uniref:Uncharacterized protein n=1 Tax=Portunus trituberculatus TaxID=210409 RepID=A0A5B7FSU7_PORTR|nr:hypothetical protein [Portunus trituberculatus]
MVLMVLRAARNVLISGLVLGSGFGLSLGGARAGELMGLETLNSSSSRETYHGHCYSTPSTKPLKESRASKGNTGRMDGQTGRRWEIR